LSKKWQNEFVQVPVMVFDREGYFDFVKIVLAITSGIYYKRLHETNPGERTVNPGGNLMAPRRRRLPASAGALFPS
jgi:hypothetical protein